MQPFHAHHSQHTPSPLWGQKSHEASHETLKDSSPAPSDLLVKP